MTRPTSGFPATTLMAMAAVVIATSPASADKKNTEQLYRTAWNHYMGVGAPKDPGMAGKWFLLAAEQGHRDAQFWAGLMRGTGLGLEHDPEEAEAWLRKASTAGHPSAANAVPLIRLLAVQAGARADKASPDLADKLEVPVPGTREFVRSVQSHLMALGYAPGQVDGVVGRRTTAAVRAFQRDRDLETDGQVNQDLLRRLMAEVGDTR